MSKKHKKEVAKQLNLFLQKYVFKTNKKGIEVVKFIIQKIRFSKQKNRKRGIETVKFILAKIRFSKQNKQKKMW